MVMDFHKLHDGVGISKKAWQRSLGKERLIWIQSQGRGGVCTGGETGRIQENETGKLFRK